MKLEKYGYLTIEQAELISMAAESMGRDVYTALDDFTVVLAPQPLSINITLPSNAAAELEITASRERLSVESVAIKILEAWAFEQ